MASDQLLKPSPLRPKTSSRPSRRGTALEYPVRFRSAGRMCTSIFGAARRQDNVAPSPCRFRTSAAILFPRAASGKQQEPHDLAKVIYLMRQSTAQRLRYLTGCVRGGRFPLSCLFRLPGFRRKAPLRLPRRNIPDSDVAGAIGGNGAAILGDGVHLRCNGAAVDGTYRKFVQRLPKCFELVLRG